MQGDKRKLTAAERDPDYFTPKCCEFCGVEFAPTSGSAKYCPEHSRGSWERNNPVRLREFARTRQRRYRHKMVYGDPDLYDTMVTRYGERCAICGAVPEPGKYLAVDHCHTTQAFRGLLCSRCNTGLGYFKDRSERLRAAASYLDGQLL